MPFTRHTRARCNNRYLSLSFSLESRIEERERSGDERAGGSAERRWRRRRASASECERASEEVQVGGAAERERERERGERAEGRQAAVCVVSCVVCRLLVSVVSAVETEPSERASERVQWWLVVVVTTGGVSCRVVCRGRTTDGRSVGWSGRVGVGSGRGREP